jgi:hypothetical protein
MDYGFNTFNKLPIIDYNPFYSLLPSPQLKLTPAPFSNTEKEKH